MTADTGGKGTKKGKKGEEVEIVPEEPPKPVFEFGNERFNSISEEIWDARDRLNKKTIEV